MLSVRHQLDNEILTIFVDGRIDSDSYLQFAELIKEPVEAGGYQKIVFDLAGLDYISSAGLRVFLNLCRKTSKYIPVEAVNLNETVRDIFELTGFDELITIDSDAAPESQA